MVGTGRPGRRPGRGGRVRAMTKSAFAAPTFRGLGRVEMVHERKPMTVKRDPRSRHLLLLESVNARACRVVGPTTLTSYRGGPHAT